MTDNTSHSTDEQHSTDSILEWTGSPEERIIRELFRTKEGGVTPGSQPRKYGRVFETVLQRELQRCVQSQTDADVRFARGYVVEDYGSSKYDGASAVNASEVDPSTNPRFDLVCYRGDVAWTTYDGLPCALVPASFTYGVIEAKRTLSPGYFSRDSSRKINSQLRRQREALDDLGVEGPLIVVGAHYSGDPTEIRQQAAADEVGLLGSLSDKGSAAKMAEQGALEAVVRALTA